MKKITLIAAALGCGLAISTISQAWAVPMTWSLSGVTFSDGGKATGFIELDLDVVPGYAEPIYTIPGHATRVLGLAAILDFKIKVSGGNESIFPAVTYSPDTTSYAGLFPIDRPENPPTFFTFNLADLTPYDRPRNLRISPMLPLDGAIHHVPLLTFAIATLGAEECYSCGPYRGIVSGEFVLTPDPPAVVPEPSTLFLFIAGLVGVIFVRSQNQKY